MQESTQTQFDTSERTELAQEAHENFLTYLRCQARWSSGGDYTISDGLLLATTGSRFPAGPYNIAIGIGEPANARALRPAVDWFADRNCGLSVYARDRIDGDLERECHRRYMLPCGELPVMAVTQTAVSAETTTGVELIPVSDEADRKTFARIAANSYCMEGVPSQVVLDAFGRLGRDFDPEARLFLAIADDTPVGGGLVLFGGDVAGIYWVSVLPEFRRKGYGALLAHQLTRFALSGGARHVVLQATPMAVRIYEQVGFRRVDSLRCYCLPLAPAAKRPGRTFQGTTAGALVA